jgi:hypothetical protein
MMRTRQPGSTGSIPIGCTTGPRRCALPCTSARINAGSVRLILSYSACTDTPSLACLAAAFTELRNPIVTIVIRLTTVENINCFGYWRPRCVSNTSSTHFGEIDASSSARAIALRGKVCSNRSNSSSSMCLPLLFSRVQG